MQQLKESSCDYESFIRDFTEMVKEMMGKEYSTKLCKVIKNNSLELDSLVLVKAGSSLVPGIYLLPYYNEYLMGADMVELANKLCDYYRSCDTPAIGDDFTYSFESIKGKITYRLVNYEKNRKLLDDIPHIKYLDLAVTYHCLIQNNESGIAAIRITNEHISKWKISVKELHKLAVINTKREFPPVIRTMDEVISSILNLEINKENGINTDIHLQDMHNHVNNDSKNNMYVLSNSIGINGATCLLYNNVLKKFSEKLQADLYILPSSIHEVILIPDNGKIDKEELAKMVSDINRTQVACDEVLSDRVYYYSGEYNAIM
jgi:hypothetical protein